MALCEKDTEAQRMIEGELKRGPGAPEGNTNNRYSSKEEDTIVNNVNSCIERPMGNSKRAGIRKLEKDRPDLIDQELTRKPGAPVGNQFASKEEKTNHDNVMNSLSDHKATQGNSIEYTLRRLRKDHPELHEKVLARLLLMAANPPTKPPYRLAQIMLNGQRHGFCLTQQALADKEQSQRKLGKVGNPTGNNQYSENERNPSDSKVSKSYGETTDYLLDRIERDFPEVYASID